MFYGKTSYSYTSTSNVVLSQKATRFWIPFDVKLFESKTSIIKRYEKKPDEYSCLALTPKEYLGKYCRVNPRQYTLYKRIFDKHKNIEAELNIEALADALFDVYMGTMDNRLIRQVIILLDLSSNEKITLNQFIGIAAFSERYCFKIFRQFDDIDSQLQKDILEILDFSSLKWKLFGINISPTLREILKLI
ncbi:unnamed protein product [Rotaria sordida]|uniref:Uncharacterized protein n=1 Tax=Rotaria sordida TaxID=392033 RepID=A0A818RF62_9BILA|nr:unnamed protein product [Rotaria sordida]